MLALALACRRSSDPVRDAIDGIVAAAKDRDAAADVDRLTTDFAAADGSGRDQARDTLRRYFAAYEILNVSVRGVEIERAENVARVRLTAELSGQPRRIGGLEGLLPSASTYRFELRLVPEDGRWKVAWASWSQEAGR